jgi:hypothetical protein
MTSMPARDALRPREDFPGATPVPAGAPAVYAFDEPCAVLLGWQRREAVLRMLTTTRAVIGGVAGLRPGDRLLLVLQRGQAVVREGRVLATTLGGVEIEHYGTGMMAEAGLA